MNKNKYNISNKQQTPDQQKRMQINTRGMASAYDNNNNKEKKNVCKSLILSYLFVI